MAGGGKAGGVVVVGGGGEGLTGGGGLTGGEGVTGLTGGEGVGLFAEEMRRGLEEGEEEEEEVVRIEREGSSEKILKTGSNRALEGPAGRPRNELNFTLERFVDWSSSALEGFSAGGFSVEFSWDFFSSSGKG